MKPESTRKVLRCAIYTRVSTDAGLEQDFNSLDAQREASEAYIKSQAHEGWKLIRDRFDDGGFSGGSMERPALQKLLDDVKSRKIDTIVVYKVDRLTRSLADFAKLVELFDAHGVSFVSVTQSFNTTTSMGRLTLNVLLSFAQFEREVTGERIRDKIAASKKKGIWMGGPVPLGYRLENRKLLTEPSEAETVRRIFDCYLRLGSLTAVIAELDRQGVRTRQRRYVSGRTVGGVPFSKGPLVWLLRNRIYIGEIRHKGEAHPGDHEPIIDRPTFAAVQERLSSQTSNWRRRRHEQGALLTGLLFDDRGNRMTPTWAVKNGVRYRYYVSAALMQGRGHQAGSMKRVPAVEIEQCVLRALGNVKLDYSDTERADETSQIDNESGAAGLHQLVRDHVERVVVSTKTIELALVTSANDGGEEHHRIVTMPWSPPSPFRKRDVIQSNHQDLMATRAMGAKARDIIIHSLSKAHRWLDELVSDPSQTIERLAAREKRTERSVRHVLSLAFVAPDIVKAAVDGRLPRGLGMKRLIDLPMAWAEQWTLLGLRPPIQS